MDMKLNVLFRYSKKTGKIDTTMTGMGDAMMRLWALQNTTPSKTALIVERDTGKVLYLIEGTKSGFPKLKDAKTEDLGTIDEYGIPLSEVKKIRDERFDKPEEVEKKKTAAKTTRER